MKKYYFVNFESFKTAPLRKNFLKLAALFFQNFYFKTDQLMKLKSEFFFPEIQNSVTYWFGRTFNGQGQVQADPKCVSLMRPPKLG